MFHNQQGIENVASPLQKNVHVKSLGEKTSTCEFDLMSSENFCMPV